MNPACDLTGVGVLVTRPAAQAHGLCALLRDAGAHPIAFPTVEILPGANPQQARTRLCDTWDLMIFVSRNAVERARSLVSQPDWPNTRHLAAVGRATAQALAAAGRTPDLIPAERYDSEALLALPELSRMAGERVLIVRGEGGRALLGDELARRGADVSYAEVYRRILPATADTSGLLSRWQSEVQVVTATSDEILANLAKLLGEPGRRRLLDTPLAVISERTAASARALGFERVQVATRADDRALVEAICTLAAIPP